MCEDGTWSEVPALGRGGVDRDSGDVGREQVRVTLYPREASADRDGHRLGEHRLADTGDVLDEEVPRRQDGRRGGDDGVRRAEDDSAQVCLERLCQPEGVV